MAKKNLRVISVVQTKGGVGKTTLSLLAAQRLAELGRKVYVFDTDEEGSAYMHQDFANRAGTELPYEVVDSMGLSQLTPSEYDYQITDTPPNNKARLIRVVQSSDYLIIPVMPGGSELDRLMVTMDVISTVETDRQVQVGMILNGADNTRVARETREWIEEQDYPLLTELPRRTAFREAFGSLFPQDLTVLFDPVVKEWKL